MAGAVETCSWVSLFLQGSESNVRHCWLGPAKCGETCGWVLFWRGEAGLAGPAAWLQNISPNLCVGFLFLILYPGTLPRPPPPAPPPSHNLSPTTLSHTTCYPQLCHTQLVTHNFVTHNFVTHNLSRTTCHPQLCHTQLVTHNLSPTTLSHTTCHPQLCHPQLCHTQLVTHNFVTHPAAFCVAGVALGDMCLCFTWQAWHLATSTCVSRGRRGTFGTGLALVARLGWD